MQREVNYATPSVSSTTPCVMDNSPSVISYYMPNENAMDMNTLSLPDTTSTSTTAATTTTYYHYNYEEQNNLYVMEDKSFQNDVKPYLTPPPPPSSPQQQMMSQPQQQMMSPVYNPTTPTYNGALTPIYNPTSPIYNSDDVAGATATAGAPTTKTTTTATTTTATTLPIVEYLPTLSETSFFDCLKTQKLVRKFCSLNENLFNFLQRNFLDATVHNIQRLSRADIITLLAPNHNSFVQPIDKLMQNHNWSIYRRLSKSHMQSRDELVYTYNVECQRETTNIRKIFFEDDMLALHKIETLSYMMNFFDIDHRVQYKFQQCIISSVCWTRTMYTQSGQSCVEVLEKLLHKNGRYDYNYSLIWELSSPKHLESEIDNFEAFLRYKIPRVMAILLDDVHQRQNWCDNMLTLKPTRYFSIATHGKKDTGAWARALYIAPKIDGERCFGFLSSSGLLVITSTTTHNIPDPGVRNLKQTYYVVVERVGNLFFLIDIMSILQFTINLNPSFTSNNKMFETDLYPINVSVTDSIKYITKLPTETILKNSFTRMSDVLLQKLDQISDLQIPRPNANINYDGFLTFSDDCIYKLKQTHTIELEVCLRSLLIQKLNEPKPPPAMHRFLKQWKKKQIIVGPILFRAFPVKELSDIFRHVYFSNKERFCLLPIDWGNYINAPRQFIRHHFSTFCNQRVDTGSLTASAATGAAAAATNDDDNNDDVTSKDTIPIMEIYNTRVIVEFSCSQYADTSEPYLKYLRIRYDKLKADSPQKVKNIILNLQEKTNATITTTNTSL